jgi:hypothetical protein
MFRPSTLFASAILAATLGALPLAGTAANAQSTAQITTQSTHTTTAQSTTAQQSAAPCRKIRVTGQNVAIRDFPFVNGLVLRTLRTGTILTTCERAVRQAGSSYPSKCGFRGDAWYKVRSGRTTVTGSPFGFVPATCVRVL